MRPLALFVPPALRRWLRRAVGRGPRNFKRRSPSQLAQDVQEALLRVNAARQTIARLDLECRELRILEIGPGYNFGPLLLLAGQGALVTAADRFLVSWDDAYHPAFYRALRESWPEPTPVLDRVIAERGYGDALTLLPDPQRT